MEKVMVYAGSGDCIRMSTLIMGTDHLGGNSKEATFKLLDQAVKLGINIGRFRRLTFKSASLSCIDENKNIELKDVHKIMISMAVATTIQ